MPVEIQQMRSEISIQSDQGNAGTTSSGAAPGVVDMSQLRDTIREVVIEIVQDDLYALLRSRGL